jgi:hypothetical protein
VLQEMLCYRDVLLRRRFVWRRFVKETFRVETFCMCAVQKVLGNLCHKIPIIVINYQKLKYSIAEYLSKVFFLFKKIIRR